VIKNIYTEEYGMRIKVMYYTRSGNTKKVAEAIAEEFDTNEEKLPPAFMPERDDLLFIGAGVYMGNADSKVRDFIRILTPAKIKNVAVFGTGAEDKAIKAMKELLKAQGINVVEESFLCRGKTLGIFSRKHPDEKDLENARNFAKNVVSKLVNTSK
jgi:flavodoxin